MALPRTLTILLGLAATVVVAAGLRAVAWLAGPVFLALVIVITTSPVQTWLRRRGWPRWLSGVVLTVVVYAVMLSLFLVVVVSVTRLAELLPQYATRANDVVRSAVDLLAHVGVGAQELRDLASSVDVGKVMGIVGTLVAGFGSLVTNLVFLLALLLFMCTEATLTPRRLGLVSEDRPHVTEALRRFAVGTRGYLLVTTAFGFIVAVLDAGALWWLGIPAPLLWGVLSFVTNYIPNIGFIVGVVPPALLGLLSGGWRTMLSVVAVYVALNFVVQSLIQPRFVASSVGLSALVTVLALVLWSWLLGPLGAILAVPATLLVKALFVDVDPRARWADALVSATPAGERE